MTNWPGLTDRTALPTLAAQLAVDRRPIRQRPPILGRGRRDRIEAPLQCVVVKLVRQRLRAAARTPPAAGGPIPGRAALRPLERPAADRRNTSRILRMSKLCAPTSAPLGKRPAS